MSQETSTPMPGDKQPCSASKHIFVGSASGDLDLARTIARYLSQVEDVCGECWNQEFPLGLLTFEALEQMLRTCVGAVFVASAETCQQPNNNVMIELGLVAGRMGRTRVALYTLADVKLPSDLAAITRIQEPAPNPAGTEPNTLQGHAHGADLRKESIHALKQWARSLPTALSGLPVTQVLHGYSGRWRVVLSMDKWRSKEVTDNVVALTSDVLLHIPVQGQGGTGIAFGRITIHWKGTDQRQPYTGIFLFCTSVSDVICGMDGSMTFRTQTLIRQHVLESGDLTPNDAYPDESEAPWVSRWHFVPCAADPGLMAVSYSTEVRHDWTEGRGTAYREYTPEM